MNKSREDDQITSFLQSHPDIDVCVASNLMRLQELTNNVKDKLERHIEKQNPGYDVTLFTGVDGKVFVQMFGRRRRNLITRLPGGNAKRILSTIFPAKAYEQVFAEPISDIQVEYLDALSKGRFRHAKWIVLRGHMIIFTTLAYYVYSSTIGKLLRDLLKPTSLSD